jgi:hypothetical protein
MEFRSGWYQAFTVAGEASNKYIMYGEWGQNKCECKKQNSQKYARFGVSASFPKFSVF